ncbi:MAG TPA: hypothetical protein VGF55_10330 [Gemmataceae bacterium]|jgi:hypothetical protein
MDGWRHSGRTAVFGLAVLAAVLVPACADAAWLGYKNNTNAVVIVQASDVVIVNGQVKQARPGKAHTLYPGEVAWDPIAAAGPRLIGVYDPKQNNRLVHQDRVDCNKNDIFLSLQLVQPPQVRGQPPQSAQLRLIPTVLPAQAPGILSPGSMPPNAPPGSSSPGSRPTSPTPPGSRSPSTQPPTAPPPTPPSGQRPPSGR